ncbi:MAG: sulfite exporter TauE/SafE family protein [Candidatus Kerfeldbacteria bacterium]|nr:sulfite exporter TauE/SafE family protein [Candidatus Kerfeldbacteria bacterium]
MEILSIAILTLVAATLGTVTGFGTSTIMIPVLAIFLPPVEAILFVSIIHWFGDVWKVALFRKGLNLTLIALFGVTGLVTSYLGASISLGTNATVLLRLLGVFLAAYSVFLFAQPTFAVHPGSATAVSGGAFSGFFAGLFGIGGAIRGLFLSAFNLPKAVYIATAGAIGLMVDVTRIVTYLTGGVTLSRQRWWGLAVMIPVSFLGAWIARRVVDKIPQKKFRAVVSVFLFVIGIKLLIWP